MLSLLTKNKIVPALGVAALLLLFLGVSILATTYQSSLKLLIGEENVLGEVVYVLATALAIVVAPVSTLPLIPLATSMWGWVTTGLLSICGWMIGSQIAFLLARHFGKPLVAKLISIETLTKFEHYFPAHNLFWTIVLLRILLPVDVLSYALGLFTKISSMRFFLATLIGITPFAFIFSFTGGLPFKMQVLLFMLFGVCFLFIVYKRKYFIKK